MARESSMQILDLETFWLELSSTMHTIIGKPHCNQRGHFVYLGQQSIYLETLLSFVVNFRAL